MQRLEDASVDLVIADPPYWKVIGEPWDYQWRTDEEYVAWSLTWFREVSRVLRYGVGMCIYTGNNVCELFPTLRVWKRLSEVLR